MQIYVIARRFARMMIAPIIKYLLGENYDEYLKLKRWVDAEDEQHLKELENETQKRTKEKEKRIKAVFDELEDQDYTDKDEFYRLE